MTLIRRVFHSRVMYDVVVELLRDYLPAGQEFVSANLNAMSTAATVSSGFADHPAGDLFRRLMPLEVALNRIWRFANNRSYFAIS